MNRRLQSARTPGYELLLGIVVITLAALPATLLAQNPATFESPIPAMSPADLDLGQSLFETHCARCHGMLGEGGEGANLTRSRLTYAPDDMSLFGVISQGIPGTGMPSTSIPRPADIWRLAAYVQSLGRLAVEAMPGDPVAGKLIYASKGNCASCHILNGVGRGVGPELSEVGLRRNIDYLQRAVMAPDAEQPKITNRFRGTLNSFLTVRIVSERGTYEGMRINENEFSVQMRDLEGNIYSFDKAKLISYEKDFGHSLMPGYGAALNNTEVNDLVSYLMSLKGTAR